MRVFDLTQAPGLFQGLAGVGRAMLLLTPFCVWIGIGLALTLALLEWRVEAWARYRRAAIGAGVFLFNGAALVSIAMMVVSALLAMQGLVHHVK